jgi:hypothetical protein
VALRGRARAMPDAVPLVSPGGELCLWFRHGGPSARPDVAVDSLRPFLLADASGECIVLPAGADVAGSGSVPVAAARAGLAERADLDDPPSGERLLRAGDRIHVVGRFVAVSPESLALQGEAAARVARSEGVAAQLRAGDPQPLRDLRSAAVAGAAFVAAPSRAAPGLALPVIAAPGAGQPVVIRIGADDGAGSVYGMLAVVDSLVLVVSSLLVAWPMILPG